MTLTAAALDGFAKQPFPPDWPSDQRTFFSPIDDVHGVLKAVIASATTSLRIAMFGFDDDDLADIVTSKLADPGCFVQLTLDKSQAGGVHERKILAREDYPASSIAIGTSEHGAIQHLKLAVVDGAMTVTGSTNWSTSAETLQDNQLSVHFSRPFAEKCAARIDAVHASILQRQAKGSG